MASFEIRRRNGDVYTVLVDDEDLERVLAAGGWCLKKDGPRLYVHRYCQRNGRPSSELLHRFVTGVPSGTKVDHRNGNCLDNRRQNLRACNSAENARNARTYENNTLGMKGVNEDRRSGRFRARIRVDGRLISLGYFGTAAEAAVAYQTAAIQHFGEFARFQ
jgi:hypothetical protein